MNVIPPKILIKYPTGSEVILGRKNLFPQMILVTEDLDYYLDETNKSWFEGIPLIEQSAVIKAVDSNFEESWKKDFKTGKLRINYDFHEDTAYRSKFVEGVNDNKIKLNKYKSN